MLRGATKRSLVRFGATGDSAAAIVLVVIADVRTHAVSNNPSKFRVVEEKRVTSMIFVQSSLHLIEE